MLAALGGLMLGIGVGVMIGRRQERAVRRRLTIFETQLRRSVIPVLERRAEELGLPSSDRAPKSEDAFEVSVGLGSSIRRYEDRHELPFSDTLEADRAELAAQTTRGGRR